MILVVLGPLVILSTLKLAMVFASLKFDLEVIKGSWYDDGSICL